MSKTCQWVRRELDPGRLPGTRPLDWGDYFYLAEQLDTGELLLVKVEVPHSSSGGQSVIQSFLEFEREINDKYVSYHNARRTAYAVSLSELAAAAPRD